MSSHRHAPASRVLVASATTLLAAGVELLGSWGGHSLFLVSDALHLFAHLGIFGVLLVPQGTWHERWEDVSSVVVLALVAAIGVGITAVSLRALAGDGGPPPQPLVMLLSLVGLLANAVSAWMLADPAREWWAFRAALAHELSDGALTLVGLVGAAAIAAFGWRWVDPALSLGIGAWLAAWALRLLVRRARRGSLVWAEEGLRE